ncbi:hypothetical protein ACQR1K_04370 [Bradyrhizobium sp. HKCCYLRH3095]|uniref:hypothetical protein n=1 Tax=Bradyrhizobium sp. HKCCYLRH3095 TaxID=3420765 RepID=UPI003EBE1762
MPKRMTPKLLDAFADQSWSYETFSPDGRWHLVCPHCRAVVLLCEGLSSADRSEIARLRHGNSVEAIKMLTRVSGCDVRQAKANVLHVRDSGARCHNCKHEIPKGALLCSRCMAVNLDW